MNRHTKRFIAASLIYFFLGCSLGLFTVLYPELVTQLRPAHAHINLLGWVSMMIIGVSYFVIPVFIGRELFSDKGVTLHFIVANIGIIGMVYSFITQNYSLLPLFAVTELVSSYLFTFNIIATAIKGPPVEKTPKEWNFLKIEANKELDRWASYFTQAATIYFLIGCTLGGYIALSYSGWAWLKLHFHLNLAGWITMMILGVAYHIFPRFSSIEVRSVPLVKTNFIVANLGLVMMAGAMIYGELGNNGVLSRYLMIFAGVIECMGGVIFVYNILPSVAGAGNTMGKASVKFVKSSLSYFMVGIFMGLFMALNPESGGRLMPVHAHLNVLGWITMMIYGVGYYIIPSFAGKKLHSPAIATAQFWVANIGLIGFLSLYPLGGEYKGLTALFAAMEFTATLLFIYNIARSVLKKSSQEII